MIRKTIAMVCAAVALLAPIKRVHAQELLRLPKDKLAAFVAHAGGIAQARSTILANTTPQSVREALADSLAAIANSISPETATRALSTSEALGALLLLTESNAPKISEIGVSRLTRMALVGNTLLVRLNGVTALGMIDDKARGASALKKVATSSSDAAGEAVSILGASYGSVGVSTLRAIFNEKSTINKEAEIRVAHFAKRYKWTR